MAGVLVVEDRVPVLGTTQSILGNAGYRISAASTVDEALATINSDERLDLLFSEIHLAGQAQAGLHLGKEFARSRPGRPVLYTTFSPLTPGWLVMFVEPHAFISKPYTALELLSAVWETC